MMGKVSSRRKKENTSLRPKTTSSDDDHVVRVDCFGSNATDRQVIFIFQKYTSPPPSQYWPTGARPRDHIQIFLLFWLDMVRWNRPWTAKQRARTGRTVNINFYVQLRRPTTDDGSDVANRAKKVSKNEVKGHIQVADDDSRIAQRPRDVFFPPQQENSNI